MKKILLVLVAILLIISMSNCIGSSTTKIDKKEPEWKITEFVPYLKKFNMPEKSEYETKAEYEKKIDSIKNSVEYKKMLTDTFAMVVNNLSIATGYDAETKSLFFSPRSSHFGGFGVHYEEDEGCTYQESNAYGASVEVKEIMYSFYDFNVKNEFFKQSKNNKCDNVYCFHCKADIAKKEKEFKYKIYFSLSDFNVESSERVKEETIDSPIKITKKIYILNVDIYKIEVILDDNIIFTIGKDNQKEVQLISLPEMFDDGPGFYVNGHFLDVYGI